MWKRLSIKIKLMKKEKKTLNLSFCNQFLSVKILLLLISIMAINCSCYFKTVFVLVSALKNIKNKLF